MYNFLIIFYFFIFFNWNYSSYGRSTLSSPIISFKESVEKLSISPLGRYLAFLDKKKRLYITDLNKNKFYEIAKNITKNGFVWTPYGFRLIFRSLFVQDISQKEHFLSQINIHECTQKKTVLIKKIPYYISDLNLDPRDLRLRYLKNESLYSLKLNYPNTKLAAWQFSQRSVSGFWLASKKAIYWFEDGLLALVSEKGESIESYQLSSKGTKIVWSTLKGKIYISVKGKEAKFIDFGKDPSWLSTSSILYAGARRLGQVSISYDIKLAYLNGVKRWLTFTRSSNERWPVKHPKKDIAFFTRENTSDLFILELNNDQLHLSNQSFYRNTKKNIR